MSILVPAALMFNLALAGVAAAAPDINGIWDPMRAPGIGHPPAEDVKLTPEGQAEYQSFSEERDPTLRCIMPGVPLGIDGVNQETSVTF